MPKFDDVFDNVVELRPDAQPQPTYSWGQAMSVVHAILVTHCEQSPENSAEVDSAWRTICGGDNGQ